MLNLNYYPIANQFNGCFHTCFPLFPSVVARARAQAGLAGGSLEFICTTRKADHEKCNSFAVIFNAQTVLLSPTFNGLAVVRFEMCVCVCVHFWITFSVLNSFSNSQSHLSPIVDFVAKFSTHQRLFVRPSPTNHILCDFNLLFVAFCCFEIHLTGMMMCRLIFSYLLVSSS